MKTSIAARLAAIAASTLMTFLVVATIANYALPEEQPLRLAQAPRR